MSTSMTDKLVKLEERVSRGLDIARVPPSIAHVLRCCELDVATRAVDEALNTLSSGKVKALEQLMLATLLRHRSTNGGAVWLRRLNGLPLPAAAAKRLRIILDEVLCLLYLPPTAYCDYCAYYTY